MSKVQWLGDAVSAGTLGLFDSSDPECETGVANTSACTALCFSIGMGPLIGECVAACLKASCGKGSIVTGPELKKGLPSVVPGGVPEPYQLYPYGVVASETKTLQAELNKKLIASGLCPMTVDGKVGPATCGAAAKYGVPVPSCAGHPATAPVPCGVPQPKPAPPTPTAGAGAAPSSVSWGWIVAGVIGIGVVVYLSRGSVASNPSEPRPKFKVHLERVRLNSGGYDSRGRYWGVGEPLYRYSDDSGAIDGYVRAANRAQAKEKVVYRSPGIDISFYRA